ncbi:hypothetical protein GDO81_010369 [Engystomops pustulosus]|uniref:Secreted protein n=1 Tax=Engystomops pustulosus TaxID=76066 RepID=A0AAV7C0Q9_ENGPU|nr:hypothetical protein GDO81_010369 [Engystomops pustulosus]
MIERLPLTLGLFILLDTWLCVRATLACLVEGFIQIYFPWSRAYWAHSLHLDMAAFILLKATFFSFNTTKMEEC